MSLHDKFENWFMNIAFTECDIQEVWYWHTYMRSAFNAGYALRNSEMKALIQVEQDKCIFAEEELVAEQLNQIAESRRKGNN